MAVRMLAGPFPLIDDTGTATAPGSGFLLFPIQWVPQCGLVMQIYNYLCRVTMDGVVENLCSVVGFQSTFWGFDAVMTQMLSFVGGKVYSREKIALCPYLVIPPFPSPIQGAGTCCYDLAGRRVQTENNQLWSGATGATTFTQEGPATIGFGSANCTMGPGRTPTEIFIGWANTTTGKLQGVFYDTVNLVLSSPLINLGIVGGSVIFAPDFGVLVSVSANYTISVWSPTDVVPVSLSAPVVVAGTGGGYTVYQVQVMGADADWAIGALVEWSITGTGILLNTQSASDDNGMALCQVVCPPTDSGTTVVNASLVC